MVDQVVRRIRPGDRELSTVQDNLANVVDQLCSHVNNRGNAKTLGMGTYWSWTKGMPTANAPMLRTICTSDGGTFQQMRAFEIVSRPGYVVSIQGGANGAISGYTFTLTLYINNKPTNCTATSVDGRAHMVIKPGQYKYAAGDELSLYIRGSSSSINQSFSASIDVESAA